jgi:hypothetical protein
VTGKIIQIDTHLVQDRDIEMGQRITRRIAFFALDQSLVIEAAPGQYRREVFSAVTAGA